MGAGLAVLLSACAACAEPAEPAPPPAPAPIPIEVPARPSSFLLEPGRSYRFHFDQPIEDPLGYMKRMPLILKADDFGGDLNDSARRYLAHVGAAGQVSSFGIITSLLTDEPVINEGYRSLDAAGFEMWFHGHTHFLSTDVAEFRNRPLADQIESFTTGHRRALETLGLALDAFGAPGNAFDTATSTAIQRVGFIEVWLYGPVTGPSDEIPRLADIEHSAGVMGAIADVLPQLDNAIGRGPEVLSLQVHPSRWQADDHQRFETIFDDLVARDRYRFTGPVAYSHWKSDRDRIVAHSCGGSDALLDLTQATYPQRIDFDPKAVAPKLVEVLDCQ